MVFRIHSLLIETNHYLKEFLQNKVLRCTEMAVNDLAHLLSSIFAPEPQLIFKCGITSNSKMCKREVDEGAGYTENRVYVLWRKLVWKNLR